MCGIFGIVCPDKSLDRRLLRRMGAVLGHRGPDDEGYMLADLDTGEVLTCSGPDSDDHLGLASIDASSGKDFDLAFGHRRLSILDLSVAGHQPMSSATGRFWITYNGEVYNYLELRQELRRKGHVFESGTDTEVILAAYEEWGAEMLTKLVGMFAFAIFDRQRRSIFCARDFFGIKPLYYTAWNGGLAFASEIKALLEIPWVRRNADPQRVFEYLRYSFSDHGGSTFFAHIRQLPAAHYLEIPVDTMRLEDPRRYWRIDPDERADLSFEHAASKLRDLFLESIGLHLRSDVPVGVCLSGGIDSSSIVMGMRHVLGKHAELHAFTYVADDPGVSEERWADLVAEASGAVHHKVTPTDEDLVDDIEALLNAQDEPLASTSPYAQHRVYRKVREAGIKVMLDGQGADEILGGYHSLVAARLSCMLRKGQWLGAAKLFLRGTRQMEAYRTRLLLTSMGRLAPHFVQPLLRRIVREQPAPPWLNADWFLSRGVGLRPRTAPSGPNLFREEARQFVEHLSLPQLLRWEDRNSMCVSVESRVPFLTPALVQFVFALPDRYVINSRGLTKAVFREAMRGIVPDPILDRKDKIGFVTPERIWLNRLRPWAEGTLESVPMDRFPCVDPVATREEFLRILSGNGYYSGVSWRWLNTIHWVHHWNAEFS